MNFQTTLLLSLSLVVPSQLALPGAGAQDRGHAFTANQRAVYGKLKNTEVGSPWRGRGPTGRRVSDTKRAEYAKRYERKLHWSNREGGVVLAQDGRLLPNGTGVDNSKPAGRPWTSLRMGRRSHPARAMSAVRVAERLRDLGHPSTLAEAAAAHVALGLPSESAQGSRTDRLIVRKDRVFSYNAEKNVANWVSWVVSRETVGGSQPGKRTNDMRPDHSLPVGMYRATPSDYYGSGFDPGHMVASADRRSDPRATERTNVMSNMLPQAPSNNRGPWVAFEKFIQSYAKEGWTVHVVAGGTYAGTARIIGNGVAVPDTTFKVAVFVKPGGSLAKGSRVLAIDVPNREEKADVNAPFTDHLVKVSDLERRTGLRFFTHLPAGTAKRMRAEAATELTQGRETISFLARKKSR